MHRSLPPLESLKVFEACARLGNFTRAADELGITPAAVSLRVRTLEHLLGIALFHRNGPRVTLTHAGVTLGAKAHEAITLLHRAVDDCRGTPAGIRLTCTPSFATRWLIPRLGRYERLPAATPIVLDVSEELRTSGAFDIAIRSGTGPWPGYSSIALMPVSGTPMMSPQLASHLPDRSIAAMLALPLLPDPRWANWLATAACHDPQPTFASTTYPTQDLVAHAAKKGLGVGLLSPVLFADEVDAGSLIAPFAHVVEGPEHYWILWPRHQTAPSFVDWLAREFQ
ncbi:MAG: LysR family transcriptional regulator [Pseudomonadota bacterium]|nr:LysR family transcriptional regulator [Pseudomonadota bacterium]